MSAVVPTSPQKTPPKAKRIPKIATHHGVSITDDYAWLRALNWQEVMRDPEKLPREIRKYLEAENTYCSGALRKTEDLQSQLFSEMKARIKQDDRTVPAPDGPYSYFSRFIPGGQYPQICRADRDGGFETVLLDGNQEGKDKSYWNMAASSHSPDHALLAYAEDDKGSERHTIKFRDLKTGKDLIDQIPGTRGDMVWAGDSRTLYYVHLDDNLRPLKVFRHIIGTKVTDDTLVYEEQDTGFYVGLTQTQSKRFIQIVAHDHQTSEVHLIDVFDLEQKPVCIAPRRIGHEYAIEHHADRLVIMTNSDGAEDVKIVEAPLEDPAEKNWRERVPHKPGRLILDTICYRNHMVRLERENGLLELSLRVLTITPSTKSRLMKKPMPSACHRVMNMTPRT